MKKGIFILLSKVALFLVLGLFFCRANAANLDFIGPISSNTPTATNNIYSGKVRPLGSSDSTNIVAPFYAGIVVPSLPVTDEQYENLGVCPANPVCPDINGKTFNNAAVDCPDFCTVDRTVVQDYIRNIVRIISTVAAACPSGYSVVGTYKVGQEIVRQNNPPPAPFPIPNYDTYSNYVLAGYTCILIPQGPVVYCGGNGGSYVSLVNPVLTPSSPAPIPPNLYIGQFTSVVIDPVKYFQIQPYCTAPGPPGGIPGFGVDTKYTYTYAYLQCTPQPGLFYSGNLIPTSLVCAVRRATWQKAN